MKRTHSESVVSGICGAAFLFGLASTASAHNGEQDGKLLGPLVWVDKDGKTIGRAVGGGNGGGGAVQLKIEGLSLIVPVDNKSECAPGQSPFNCDRFLAVTWGAGSLVFKDADCKGEAFVTGLTTGSDRAVGLWGQTLYIGDSKPKSTAVTIKAVVINGVCDANVSPPPFNTAPGWKVEKTLGLWTLGFKPPFRLK
jgi:hypothetical protein